MNRRLMKDICRLCPLCLSLSLIRGHQECKETRRSREHPLRNLLAQAFLWVPLKYASAGQEVASAILGANNEVQRLADQSAESPEAGQGPGPLSWLPQTLAAVALRLYSLDANLVYTEGGQPGREELLVTILPAKLASRNCCDLLLTL